MSEPLGHIFIIAAPSGGGKTSLIKSLLQNVSGLGLSVSHTTRPPRPGEENGTHYHFCDKTAFETLRDQGEFIEWAEVFGNYYGTSKSSVEAVVRQGLDVILEIDWQGAQQVRSLFDNLSTIFILPPSREVLLERLRSRGQDSEEVIATRTQEAINEISHFQEFDYLIINQDFDQAAIELKAVILAQRLKMIRQNVKHQQLIKQLLED